MLFSRRASVVAAATTPTVACPMYHSHRASAESETISAPFSAVSIMSMLLTMRISRVTLSRNSLIASCA